MRVIPKSGAAVATAPAAPADCKTLVLNQNRKKYKLNYLFSGDDNPPVIPDPVTPGNTVIIKFGTWFNGQNEVGRKRRTSEVFLTDEKTKKRETLKSREAVGDGSWGAVRKIGDAKNEIQAVVKAPVEGVFPLQIGERLVLPHWQREAILMNRVYPGQVRLIVKKDPKANTITWRLVMPLLGDCTLHEAVTNNPQEKWLIYETARVELKRIHELGIVHGDVKSTNIRMKKVDGKWQAFFVDFGEAYLQGEPRKTVKESFLNDSLVRSLCPFGEHFKSCTTEEVFNSKVRELITNRLVQLDMKVIDDELEKNKKEIFYYSPEQFDREDPGQRLIAKFAHDYFAFAKMINPEARVDVNDISMTDLENMIIASYTNILLLPKLPVREILITMAEYLMEDTPADEKTHASAAALIARGASGVFAPAEIKEVIKDVDDKNIWIEVEANVVCVPCAA